MKTLVFACRQAKCDEHTVQSGMQVDLSEAKLKVYMSESLEVFFFPTPNNEGLVEVTKGQILDLLLSFWNQSREGQVNFGHFCPDALL